jgi:hypothetical protein
MKTAAVLGTFIAILILQAQCYELNTLDDPCPCHENYSAKYADFVEMNQRQYPRRAERRKDIDASLVEKDRYNA